MKKPTRWTRDRICINVGCCAVVAVLYAVLGGVWGDVQRAEADFISGYLRMAGCHVLAILIVGLNLLLWFGGKDRADRVNTVASPKAGRVWIKIVVGAVSAASIFLLCFAVKRLFFIAQYYQPRLTSHSYQPAEAGCYYADAAGCMCIMVLLVVLNTVLWLPYRSDMRGKVLLSVISSLAAILPIGAFADVLYFITHWTSILASIRDTVSVAYYSIDLVVFAVSFVTVVGCNLLLWFDDRIFKTRVF